jgi:AraC family transcriptional regulator
MSLERTTEIRNVGRDFGKSFRLRDAPSLLLASNSRPQMAVTRITVPTGLSEPAGPVLPERGFTIPVYLRKPLCQNWGTWVDGKFLPVKHWEEGGIGIYDLESNPRAWRTSAYDCVHFNLPRATLDAFTADNEVPRIDTLICTQGKRDDLLFGLAKFILPWLGNEIRVCDLTFDYFVLMFCSHIAKTYANSWLPRSGVGGLAPWQRRRVVEIVDAGLSRQLRLSTLAEECRLSVSHFSRSFKQSFGIPAHRYLVHCRIEYAKSLLKHSSLPLAEIALRSGFSDQAAFTRTFGALIGTSPRRWLNEFRAGRSLSGDLLSDARGNGRGHRGGA